MMHTSTLRIPLDPRVPSSAAFIAREDEWGAHNYRPLDLVIASASGAWVTDVDGKRYLDCLSAYSAVNHGHCHPRILETMSEQAARVTLTSRAFRNDQLGAFCEELATVCDMEMVLPMNTGAEAVETAIKAARRWGYRTKGIPDGQATIIAFSNNFHGRTTTLVGFSSEPSYRDGFGPFTPGFVLAPFGDIEAVRALMHRHVCAVLVEPIQCEAGVLIPPTGFLRALADLCREHDVLLIADEIQTGLGRTGTMFGCDADGVKPDVLVLGKAYRAGFIRCRLWCPGATYWACSDRVPTAAPSVAIRWAVRWRARRCGCCRMRVSWSAVRDLVRGSWHNCNHSHIPRSWRYGGVVC